MKSSKRYISLVILSTGLFLMNAEAQVPQNKALATLEAAPVCAPPPPKDPSVWSKSLIFGFNLTDGNSETLLLNTKASVSRDFENNIWNFLASSAYGEDSTKKDEGGTTTNQQDARVEASYKRLFTERFYSGFATNYFYDKVADIDYRVTLKPTVGYFVVRNDVVKLSFETGPGYVFERVGEVKKDFFAPLIGERLEWVISESSKLFQTAEVVFDADDSDNYLITTEAGLEAAINSHLSLVLSARNLHDGVPAEGKEKSDTVVGSALKVNF